MHTILILSVNLAISTQFKNVQNGLPSAEEAKPMIDVASFECILTTMQCTM